MSCKDSWSQSGMNFLILSDAKNPTTKRTACDILLSACANKLLYSYMFSLQIFNTIVTIVEPHNRNIIYVLDILSAC